MATQRYRNEILYLINAAKPVDYAICHRAFAEILALPDTDARMYYMASVLHALMASVPSVEAITGLLDAAFELDDYQPSARPLLTLDRPTVTYVGSGKKGFKTVNISSLSAFVACCRDKVAIAKYCSPSTSSITGSQDFIEMLGAKLACPTEAMTAIMSEMGIGYYRLEHVVPRFASLYSGRFMAPHALSFALAGMVGCFQTEALIYGFANPHTEHSLEVFRHYKIPQVTVVASTTDGVHYIDELSDAGQVTMSRYQKLDDSQPTQVLALKTYTHNLDAQATLTAIAQAKDPQDNIVKGLRGLMGKEPVLAKQLALNAALVVSQTIGIQEFEAEYGKALEIIKSGEPINRLRQFVKLTGGTTTTLDALIDRAKG